LLKVWVKGYNNSIGPVSDAAMSLIVVRQKGKYSMYGTVAHCRIKPGAEAQLLAELREFEQAHVPGTVATLVYRMDADGRECYIAVAFSDKEAYLANARSEEQDQRYHQMLRWLEGPPEWHDGEIVAHLGLPVQSR
jgi:quinol monooxygenase YgiN